MPHPLSELITARLDANENKDPHARTTITNAEAVEIRAALNGLVGKLKATRTMLDRSRFESVDDSQRVSSAYRKVCEWLEEMEVTP